MSSVLSFPEIGIDIFFPFQHYWFQWDRNFKRIDSHGEL